MVGVGCGGGNDGVVVGGYKPHSFDLNNQYNWYALILVVKNKQHHLFGEKIHGLPNGSFKETERKSKFKKRGEPQRREEERRVTWLGQEASINYHNYYLRILHGNQKRYMSHWGEVSPFVNINT